MLNLLQVCNVGRITGGTAACAWTITRCLPDWKHAVAFLSRPNDETRDAFAHCSIAEWQHVSAQDVAALRPDIVLLHNTPRDRVDNRLPALTVQYLHSRIDPAPADLTLYCSRWLAAQYDADTARVCYQPVPRPRPRLAGGPPAAPLEFTLQRDGTTDNSRPFRDEPIIGRLCTPVRRKWPDALVPFYRTLADRFPTVHWEFVGCPEPLQPALADACHGRAVFFPAAWTARARLWHWDALLYHHAHLTESFGRTAAEAMRAGCLPIVDARGGFCEQVTPACGFLCRDLNEFAAAIERIHSPGRRLAMSRAARAHADERFSLTRFRQELLSRLASRPLDAKTSHLPSAARDANSQ